MLEPDKDKFIKLISENKGIIIKISNLYTNTKSDFEDLKQEIIFQLWKSFPRFKGNSKFTTWMYKVALNTAITNIKKSKRHPIFQAFSSSEYKIPSKDFNNNKEEISNLYNAISRLNDIDKAIILLYLEEKKYSEIAEIVGLSEKNISVKLVRIKKKLKALLNDGQ